MRYGDSMLSINMLFHFTMAMTVEKKELRSKKPSSSPSMKLHCFVGTRLNFTTSPPSE